MIRRQHLTMAADDRLLSRVRGEYEEMPGLRLNLQQACRLWQLDAATCTALLDRLVLERFLHRMHDGSYIAFPSARAVKAELPAAGQNTGRVRRRA